MDMIPCEAAASRAQTPHTMSSATHRPKRPDFTKPANEKQDKPTSSPRATTPLSDTQRRYLRSQCHHLKPLILLGNKGVTSGVQAELDATLEHHELVKIRLSGGDRDERQQQLDALLSASGAELVQQIGHVASLFRRNQEQPRLALPR